MPYTDSQYAGEEGAVSTSYLESTDDEGRALRGGS